jgi:hypothetical protein
MTRLRAQLWSAHQKAHHWYRSTERRLAPPFNLSAGGGEQPDATQGSAKPRSRKGREPIQIPVTAFVAGTAMARPCGFSQAHICTFATDWRLPLG